MTNLDRKSVGKLGEDITINYLERKGYKILERNYLPKFIKSFKKGKGEIDIIAKKKKTIHFIEVKTIVGDSQDFFPEDKVDFRKKKNLIRTAKFYLLEKKISQYSKWQIDVLSIKIDFLLKKAKLRFFLDAVADVC